MAKAIQIDYNFTMHARFSSFMPSLRQISLWIALGLVLAAIFHGYWLLCCILIVGAVALFILLHSGS